MDGRTDIQALQHYILKWSGKTGQCAKMYPTFETQGSSNAGDDVEAAGD